MQHPIRLIEENLGTVEEILTNLDLRNDQDLARQLNEIRIELDGVSITHLGIDTKTAELLSEIHADSLNNKLESIISDALGYYALAEQPCGTNELPIGPIFAQQLIRKIQHRTTNIMAIKDELHLHMCSSNN